MSSKRISHKQKAGLLRNRILLKELSVAMEQYCPEMGNEVINSGESIGPWLERVLGKLPEDVRKRIVND